MEERAGLDHNGINSPMTPLKKQYYVPKRAAAALPQIKQNTNHKASRDDKQQADCFDNRLQ